ncbi:MAG: chorismate lyase [Sterolibacterium sp.]
MDHTSWRPFSTHVEVPAYLRPWLTDEASLTARIKARCSRFNVRVLRDGLALPHESERRLLGLRRGACGWAREVLLLADGHAVVFAHSVAARRDLSGPWRMAAGIGTRPLGEALFADPTIARCPFHVARIAVASPLHRCAEIALEATLPPLWARRSRFLRYGRPLLVTEVFLPGIESLG